MESKLARSISIIFHPVFIPFFLLLFLLSSMKYEMVVTPVILKVTLSGLVFLTTVLMPLSFIWLLKRLRFIHSLYLATKEERPYPLITMAIFYYVTYFIIRDVPVSPVFNIYILGASLISGLTSIISIFRKISLHTAGAGTLAGLFLGLAMHHGINVLPELLVVILLSGITGWARLTSDTHTPGEIYAGFFWGTGSMGMLLLLF